MDSATRHHNTHHDQLMADYYAAEEVWLMQREQECNGYATEQAMWEEDHPRPTLKMFLTGGRER